MSLLVEGHETTFSASTDIISMNFVMIYKLEQ